jgi:non-lysosomal glucosylceramidase
MKKTNLTRRKFVQQGGLATAGLLSLQLPAWAGDCVKYLSASQGPVHNIPADKNIDPQWIRSLYKRGVPTTYLKTRNELKYIGMPAGGLHSGTVYLGGDGRLWLWGIYNDDREGIDPKTVLWNNGVTEVKVRNRDGASYVEPAIADNKRVLEQGFALKLQYGGRTIIKELKEEHWDEISFEATYPVATIKYIAKDLPVEVIVKAGALFIPLDADNSALPSTVFSITVHNKSNETINADVCGWFENGAAKITAKDGDGTKQNKALVKENYSAVYSCFDAKDPGAKHQRDAGTTCIAYVGAGAQVNTDAHLWPVTDKTFTEKKEAGTENKPSEKLVGSITATHSIGPGNMIAANFILGWHFNHPLQKLTKLKETKEGFYYGKRFNNALEVCGYIAEHFQQLHTQTLLWQKTFYDATLPHWFLERTFLNIGTLATANTYRFANDRFWGWEGVNACEGTCTHVWQYAQAMGRIFPSLERDCRQRTDFGIALQDNGGVIFRAEYESRPAIDGQAGVILRSYREHHMSADNQFLTANWPAIKKATIFMLAQDKNGDGMTDTPMENTLDAVWEGEIAWIVGLCIAAAKAAQMMAEDMNDDAFAKTCKDYVEKGNENMADKLFNGEYFIHRPDVVKGKAKLGSYDTCHIDQVYGQGWAFQAGLGRLWDKEKTLSALRSLWKYNFATDVGPYIKTHTGGRPYALAGEGGMVMNTNPHNDPQPYGKDVTWQLGYFHECMSGFEHQVASHMMAEGMTDEALILTRAIHDRYNGTKRNPFNEIECSDHYARAMASYGTFISACGYEYHGPKGYIRFAPKWDRGKFKAPFTAASGWGSFSQETKGDKQVHRIAVKYGTLRLKTISLQSVPKIHAHAITLDQQKLSGSYLQSGNDVVVELVEPVIIHANQVLELMFQ